MKHERYKYGKKKYEQAASKGSSVAMIRLGNYYDKIGNETRKKYWSNSAKTIDETNNTLGEITDDDYNDYDLDTILESGSIENIKHLIKFYKSTNDDDNMIKCLIVCANKNDVDSLKGLLNYYKKNNKDEYIKWCLKSTDTIEYNTIRPIVSIELGYHYSNLGDHTKRNEWFEKSKYSLNLLLQCHDLSDSEIAFLKYMVDLGSIDSMKQLGEHYKYNNDYINMIKYYEMAASNDDDASMYFLVEHYKNIQKYDDYEKWCLCLANNDHSDMVIELGHYYSEIYNDNKRRDIWFKKALDLDCINDMIAKFYYTDAELDFIDYAIDEIISLSVLRRVGDHYNNSKKYDKMIKYYELSANKHDVTSIERLIEYYRKSDDIENQILWKVKLVELSNDDTIMVELAILFKSIGEFDKMIDWLKKASNNHEAMSLLGDYYYENNMFKDMIEIYTKAVISGNNDAIHKLSDFFHREKDATGIMIWCVESANLGNRRSMIYLGLYHESLKEYDEMIGWYKKAEQKKYYLVYKKLSDYYNMIGNHDMASIYVAKELELSDQIIYDCGIECEINNDIGDMIYWYTKAANDCDNINAVFKLCLYYDKCMNSKKFLFWIKKFDNSNIHIILDHYTKLNDVKKINLINSLFTTS
jgi:TPR repeat protein